MARDGDDAKPTLEDVERVIRDHERKSATGQNMRKAIEEHIAKGQEASKRVRFKQGESLWDRAGREIDAAEKDKGDEKG